MKALKIVAVVVVVIALVYSCAKATIECEKRGGVYLVREGACVATPEATR